MSPKLHSHDELQALLSAMFDGQMTVADQERLAALLRDNPDAQQVYVDFCWTHALLRRELSDISGQWSDFEIHSSSFIPHPSAIPPIVIDPSPTTHSPLGSFLFSHMAAAVILGIGLLIGLAWRISLPSLEKPDMPVVHNQVIGHITALAHCKWAVVSGQWPERPKTQEQRPKTQEQRPKTVFLGDRLTISSGLMEITYDTGAKVILEGPCTYTIDSKRSGYLAVGKLTAHVEAGGGGRGTGNANPKSQIPNQQIANPQSLIPNPLFAIRTPTAVVTDLGTEFGVEVEKSGATRSHVFQGSVEFRVSKSQSFTNTNPPVEVLHAGESVRVERGQNNKVAVIRESGQTNHFVRQIHASPNQQSEKSNHTSRISSPLPRYRITDLGDLGGKGSCASDINNAGQIVGETTTTADVVHAFLYANGKMKDLGALHGRESHAHGINSFGQIVGVLGNDSGSNNRAFLYSDGRMKDLGTLGGKMACATAINDAGQVVGNSQLPNGIHRAFIYTSRRGMKELDARHMPNVNSYANSINESGQVAGHATMIDGSTKPFLYTPGTGAKRLGTLGGKIGLAFNLNDSGLVVGMSSNRNGVLKVLLYGNRGRVMDLGVFNAPDIDNSYMFDVNNAGQVICSAVHVEGNSIGGRSYLFHNDKLIDLNSLIERNAGWYLLLTTAINDSGQIVGRAKTPDNGLRAVLLTPVEEEGARG